MECKGDEKNGALLFHKTNEPIEGKENFFFSFSLYIYPSRPLHESNQ